jgi:hypothetical protein
MLDAKDATQTHVNLAQEWCWYLADRILQILLMEGDDRGDIYNRVARQTGSCRGQEQLPGISARRVFDVIMAARVVDSWLAL